GLRPRPPGGTREPLPAPAAGRVLRPAVREPIPTAGARRRRATRLATEISLPPPEGEGRGGGIPRGCESEWTGGGEIRTRGGLHHTAFRELHLKPLGHPSAAGPFYEQGGARQLGNQPWLIRGLLPSPVAGHLGAVAAGGHVAPFPPAGSGGIGEDIAALLVFADP